MKKIFLLMLICMLVLTFTQAFAATKTWAGGTGTGLNWTTPANWSGGTIPATNDDVVFNTAGTITFSTMPTSITYSSLTISQGYVTLQHSSSTTLTIGGSLNPDFTVAGGASLTLGSNVNITLAGSATASIAGTFTIDNSGIVSKSGTITTSTSSTAVTGVGTTFTTDAVANSLIYNSTGNCIGQVSSVTNNTSLTLTAPATVALTGQAYKALAPTPVATFNTDGTSVVTTVTGTIVNRGTLTNATASKLLLQSGSTFQHDVNNFTWPTATWDANATFNVTGFQTITPASSNFTAIPSGVKNLIWNCPNQNFTIASAATGPLTVDNLTIVNTGTNSTSQFRVSTSPITVNNNFNMSGGIMWIAAQGVDKSLNVGGNVTLTGGELDVVGTGGTYNGTLNVKGNVNISGGTLNLSASSTVGTLSDTGDFSHTGGTITETGTSTTSGIKFVKAGTQTYTSGGTVSNNVNFTVNSGATLTISGTGAIPISSFTINGTTTNNNSGALTVSTALAGTSTLTNTGVLNIGGTCSITTLVNSGTVAITGSGAISTALANFTNTGTLNLNGSGTIVGITNNAAGVVNLSSSGTITSFNNATSTSTLNISATTVPTITALTATAAGNTVNYSGAAQTVKATTYVNLTLSGTGAKTFPTGTTTVNGILSIENATNANTFTGTLAYGASATLQYNTTSARTASTEWITPFAATGGVIVANTGTITLNAAKVFNASIPLTIQSGATLATNGYALTLGGNFTCAGNFTAGAGTFTLNSSNPQTVGGATYNNLTLSGGGAKSLGGAATVNGILNFGAANNLSLGANTLTLGGTVSGAAAGQCIVTDGAGVVSRSIAAAGNFSFPIAPIAGKYNPVSITNKDASAQTFTAAVEVGENPSTIYNAYGCNRTWRLTKSGTSDADVVFTWYDADKNGSCVGSLCDVYSSEGGGAWIEKGGSGTTGTGTPYTTAVTTNVMSNWTVANSGAFPVEMTSFTAAAQKMSAQLKWNTATEVNNYGFEIERRAIASNAWAKVGFVAGNGTSNIAHNYTYADNNLSVGKYAYRLKQIDNDGAFKYSASTEVAIAGVPTELKLFGNYPNPFNPSTKVQFTVPENGNVRLRVYNVIGQEVAILFNGAAEAGNLYTVDFDGSRMASGLYFSVLEFGNQRITHKMMMTR